MKIGWIPLVGFVVITISSLLPVVGFKDSQLTDVNHLDKYIHFIMYFVWMVSLGPSIFPQLDTNKVGRVYLPLSVFLYSVLLEVLQKVLALGRSFEVLDIITNFIGVFLGYLTILKFVKIEYHGN
jgi:VanZ family protein